MAITLDDRIREDLGYLYNRQEMAGANSLQGTIKKKKHCNGVFTKASTSTFYGGQKCQNGICDVKSRIWHQAFRRI